MLSIVDCIKGKYILLASTIYVHQFLKTAYMCTSKKKKKHLIHSNRHSLLSCFISLNLKTIFDTSLYRLVQSGHVQHVGEIISLTRDVNRLVKMIPKADN